MSRRKVSVRLPEHLVRAFDRADGNRSALMRRVLREAVADGEVEGVPDDLRALAAVQQAVDAGRLDRRRGTFRKRCAEFFRDKWQGGFTTADDAEDMAESWLTEAAVYGPAYVAWVEAVVDWYSENWDPIARPDWPDPGTLHARADPESVDIAVRLVDVMREAREQGLDRATAVARVSKYHPRARVETAADQAFGGG